MRLFNPYYPNQAKIDIECRKTKNYFVFLYFYAFFDSPTTKKEAGRSKCPSGFFLKTGLLIIS